MRGHLALFFVHFGRGDCQAAFADIGSHERPVTGGDDSCLGQHGKRGKFHLRIPGVQIVVAKIRNEAFWLVAGIARKLVISFVFHLYLILKFVTTLAPALSCRKEQQKFCYKKCPARGGAFCVSFSFY